MIPTKGKVSEVVKVDIIFGIIIMGIVMKEITFYTKLGVISECPTPMRE